MVRSLPIRRMLLCGLLTAACAGCARLNHSQNGALAGIGLGAVGGAVLGKQFGRPALGGVVGAVAGGAAGNAIGERLDARDQRKEDEAARAAYEERRRLAEARAVTNREVIELSRSGAGDEVILACIEDRGCRFDLEPNDLLQLKQEGVSDTVVQGMQSHQSRALARRQRRHDPADDVELFSGRRWRSEPAIPGTPGAN